MEKSLELICPAGTPAALQVAIDAGADVVYVGFRDETNARNFPGLNFSRQELQSGIQYAHDRSRKVFVAINTYAKAKAESLWHRAIDDAVSLKADAIILADIGLLAYAKTNHPNARLHLSVQASASNPPSINFYQKAFGIKRIVLPRVLSLEEIAALNQKIQIETEVFAFGGMCTMAEGRCSLSSYVTGQSPNQNGVCSPASHVQYEHEDGRLITKLGGFTIDEYDKHESAGYPTLCKGRFTVENKTSYLFEDPVSLNVIGMLKDLIDAGVSALKIEGRQRSKAYVREVVTKFRQAIDALRSDPNAKTPDLSPLCEGQKTTRGAYDTQWQ